MSSPPGIPNWNKNLGKHERYRKMWKYLRKDLILSIWGWVSDFAPNWYNGNIISNREKTGKIIMYHSQLLFVEHIPYNVKQTSFPSRSIIKFGFHDDCLGQNVIRCYGNTAVSIKVLQRNYVRSCVSELNLKYCIYLTHCDGDVCGQQR